MEFKMENGDMWFRLTDAETNKKMWVANSFIKDVVCSINTVIFNDDSMVVVTEDLTTISEYYEYISRYINETALNAIRLLVNCEGIGIK